MKHRILAIIPARGGSKGLPGKNIRPFAGKPLIAWTIDAAKQVEIIDRIVVSTDCPEIAAVAQKYGADVPFMRPSELATDQASGMDPVFHAMRELPEYDIIVLLQPTSPLRTGDDILRAIETCTVLHATSCVSVTRASSHPYLCFTPDAQAHLQPFIQIPSANMRRQDMPDCYALNGAIYVSTRETLEAQKTFVGANTAFIELPKTRSIDIDDAEDFYYAEFLMSRKMDAGK